MIYFDNAATTKPIKEAVDVFENVSCQSFGNPNSIHLFGYQASKLLEESRAKVLSLLNLSSTHQCIFLSGASEANSMAIKSTGLRYQNRGKKILSSKVEHPSVSNSLIQMRDLFGFDCQFLPVSQNGVVEPSLLSESMDKSTILVSMMEVNNETGAIFPIGEYAKILSNYPKALLHVDATQGIGKTDCDYSKADLISFSAHKIGGIKGSGALIYKKSLQFAPLISGGEQEFGYRAGTVSVASAASLAKALEIAVKHKEENRAKATQLCERLKSGLAKIDEITINSPASHSPYLCNFSLGRHKASVVTEALSEKGIYVSSVSACSSKGEPVSSVLLAMGKTPSQAANSIRVSFSHDNTVEEVDAFLSALKQILQEVKPI